MTEQRLPVVGEAWTYKCASVERRTVTVKLLDGGDVIAKWDDGVGWWASSMREFLASFTPPYVPEPWETIEPHERSACIDENGSLNVAARHVASPYPEWKRRPHGKVLVTVIPETWKRGEG